MKVMFDLVAGKPPQVRMEQEKRVQGCCLKIIRENLILSAHDCSEGGIAAALAECCIMGNRGAVIDDASVADLSFHHWLFSESQARIIVSLRERNLPKLEEITKSLRVPMTILGRTGGGKLLIGDKISLAIEKIANNWQGALECMVKT